TVEYVLFVSLGVYDAELRRIQKAPAIQAIGRDEIAPFLATVPQVEAGTGGAETAVRSGDGTVWRGESLTGAGRNVYHQACLLAEFGRRCCGDDLHRLNRSQRGLLGAHLAR